MTTLSVVLTVVLTVLSTSTSVVQGGQIISSLFGGHNRRDPHPPQVPGLDWNAQIGNHAQNQQQQQLQFQQQQGLPCRTRDRVYLPDMQSFVIQSPMTYQEAQQACMACGSELVLIDGTLVDRFREAFSSLGFWYGEQVPNTGVCPAVLVNTLMGNRLERKRAILVPYHLSHMS
ncbi:hypothetical protein BGZ83_004898 [Gryganskiella cystojenkinii]|nr:hypothetical protein BGZ83_004898 [Gryganskiella cystojenkinii]